MISFCTDFLVPSSSFVTGMGSAFNLAGNYYSYNTSEIEEEADKKAIYNDWVMIGQDLREAMLKVKKDLKFSE